jgi:hypothetical protein
MTTFVPNRNWDRAFKSPGGMVGRDLKRRAEGVQIVAKALVGTKTETLKKSIRVDYSGPTKTGEVAYDVRATAPHAMWHHQGTAPHVIRPKKAKALKFNGRVVAVVHHPGTPANQFLSEALRMVMHASYSKVYGNP